MMSSQVAAERGSSDAVKVFAELEVAEQQAYLDAQITGHEEARPIHEGYAANGQDPMARGASMVAVTEIDSHLVMLRSFRQQV